MDFLWLEELDSPESLSWIQKENTLTVEDFKKYPGFQQHYEEGLEVHASTDRLRCRDIKQNWIYDLNKTLENPIGQWVRISYENYKTGKGAWEVLFDFDQFSKEQGKHWGYHSAIFSPNFERVLLYLTFEDGDRTWVREFDLKTKTFVPNGFEVPLSKAHPMWFNDDAILVGGDTPETQTKNEFTRTLSLWKREESTRTLVKEISKDDQSLYCYTNIEDGGGRMVLHAYNWDDVQYSWLTQDLKLTLLNLPLRTADVHKIDDDLLVRFSVDFQGFKAGSLLKTTLAEAIQSKNPQFELLWEPTSTRFTTDYVEKRGKGIFLCYRENVATKMSYFKKIEGKYLEIPQKVPQGLEATMMHMHPSSSTVLIQAESFTSPPALYEWDENDSYAKIKSTPPKFSGDYEVNQRWVVSRDGTKIPYFILHKPDLKLDGKNPTVLYGYGGFMHAQTPRYSPAVGKGWLEKGGVYVVANIRGGDEFGIEWSYSARKENKQRSYDDFIAVAENLIETKVTSPQHLAIKGGSNGGLLVGAVSMQRPELFAGVVCMMPLLDMIRYTALPPGAIWAAEYGDPADPTMKAVIEKYSPYQNIRADKKYPPIFFWTSKADDRVHPSHARRMAAKMKSMGHHCYLYEEPTGGHNGGDVKVKAFGDALMFSYLWKHLREG